MGQIANYTDMTIRGAVGRTPRIINGRQQDMPPKNYTLAPGEVLEVPDDHAAHLVETLGSHGLVSFAFSEDRAQVRERSRRQWMKWLAGRIRAWQAEQNERKRKGLELLVADDVIEDQCAWYVGLQKEFPSGAPSRAVKLPQIDPNTELTPDDQLIAAAARRVRGDDPEPEQAPA